MMEYTDLQKTRKRLNTSFWISKNPVSRFFRFLLTTLLAVSLGFNADAQVRETSQNPNYKQSLVKYSSDSIINELTLSQGQTQQDTYKAIDRYEDILNMRHERRINRYKFRQERRLARIENGYNYNFGTGFGFDYGLNYRYNPSFGFGYGFRPNYFRSNNLIWDTLWLLSAF